MAQWYRILLQMQKTQEMCVRALGQEDLLEEEMATHFTILARKILRTEEPGGPQSIGSQRVRHDLACAHTCTRTHTHTEICYYLPTNLQNVQHQW